MVDLPSESSRMAAGWRLPSLPRSRSSESSAACRPSPVAVPPSATRSSSTERASLRSSDGLSTICGVSEKVTEPIRSWRGAWSRNRSPALRAASRRLGSTSSACIDRDTSVTSVTDARSTGTPTVRSGLASARASTADRGQEQRQREVTAHAPDRGHHAGQGGHAGEADGVAALAAAHQPLQADRGRHGQQRQQEQGAGEAHRRSTPWWAPADSSRPRSRSHGRSVRSTTWRAPARRRSAATCSRWRRSEAA